MCHHCRPCTGTAFCPSPPHHSPGRWVWPTALSLHEVLSHCRLCRCAASVLPLSLLDSPGRRGGFTALAGSPLWRHERWCPYCQLPPCPCLPSSQAGVDVMLTRIMMNIPSRYSFAPTRRRLPHSVHPPSSV